MLLVAALQAQGPAVLGRERRAEVLLPAGLPLAAADVALGAGPDEALAEQPPHRGQQPRHHQRRQQLRALHRVAARGVGRLGLGDHRPHLAVREGAQLQEPERVKVGRLGLGELHLLPPPTTPLAVR